MAKVQKIPLGRKPGRAKIELPDQVQVSLAELAGNVRRGLLVFSVGVGLEVLRTLLDEDRDGNRMEARTVLWAAGVEASPIAQSLGVPLHRAGRVGVTEFLTVAGRTDVFVIGDLAAFE